MSANFDVNAVEATFRAFLNEQLAGRKREDLTDAESAQVYEQADKVLMSKHGVTLSDLLMVIGRRQQGGAGGDDALFEAWKRAYEAMEEIAETLRTKADVSSDFTGEPSISVICDHVFGDRFEAKIREVKSPSGAPFTVKLVLTKNDQVVDERSLPLSSPN